MKKKSVYLLVVVSLILLPIKVQAKVMCNDGSISPSCDVCKPGCCSKHGGCAIYIEPAPTPQPEPTPVVEETVVEQEESTIDIEENPKQEYDKTEDEEENDDLVYTIGETEEDEDEGSVAGGVAALALIGAAAYGIKKKKNKK